MDPFLQLLARTAHQTLQRPTEEDVDEGIKQQLHADAAETKDDMEDADEHAGAQSAAASGIASAAASGIASAAPRDLSFLHAHVASYQRRIEDVLSYLQEHRFGRQPGSSATAAIAALRRPAAELAREVRSLEAEWATWLLLVELRHSDETVHAQPIPPSIAERYSPQLVAARLVGTPLHPLRRALHILHWLEELQVFLLRIDSTGEVSWRRTLRRLQKSSQGDTQRDWLDPDVELRLLKAGALKAGQNVLDPQDREEEQRMLDSVWSLIRAGRLHEAIALCRSYSQHWRAASLQGGERCHDEGAFQPDGSVWRVGNPTRALWRHACRALSTAAGVSEAEASIYGLLGGELKSSLRYRGQHKYEDALYCYLKIMVDEEVEDFVRAEGKGEESESGVDSSALLPPRSPSALQLPRTLSGILSSLESPLNSLVNDSVHEQAQNNPYIRLQKCLMLGDVAIIEQEMVRTIRQAVDAKGMLTNNSAANDSNTDTSISPTYLLFAVHVWLYLHPGAPCASSPLNECGIYLVQAYLAYLESQPAQHALVPAYVQYLPSKLRVAFYVRFLAKIHSLEKRQNLLAAFEEFCPAEERLQITEKLVQGIFSLEEEDEGEPAMGNKATGSQRLMLTSANGGSGGFDAAAVGVSSGSKSGAGGVPNLLVTSSCSLGVSSSDAAKISAIDCFDVSSTEASLTIVSSALVQVLQLYRAFVGRDKFAAAKKFNEHLQNKQWDQRIFHTVQRQQIQQQQRLEKQQRGIDAASSSASPAPPLAMSPEWLALDREYAHWKLYIRCLHWYDAWLTQHSARPIAPTFNPSAYTHPSQAAQARADYALFARRYAVHEQVSAEWESSSRATVRECVNVFSELLQLDGGWLTPMASGASLQPDEMQQLRSKCIPQLVNMLMQICSASEQHELCLAVADLIASPLHNLHQCFTAEEMRALLVQFRAAYIKVQLKAPEEGDEQAQQGEQAAAQA